MAEPINNDGFSTVGTVGGSALKWGVIGAIASFVVPAVVVGGVVGLIVGSIPVLASLGVTAGLLSGLAAGYVGASAAGLPSIIGGSLLGVAKGGDRISKENQEYRNRMQGHVSGKSAAIANANSAGIQEGYGIGFNDGVQKGQEAIIAQLQQHAEQAMMAQQAASAPEQAADGSLGKHTAAVASCKCESRVEMVDKSKAAAAAANQVGA